MGDRTALRRNGEPLYRQLAEDLRARILAGEFVVTEPMPTEAQLSEHYRASRITVRHALALLDQEGLVHRKQGRGSFVRPRTISVGPRRLTSFSQEISERGSRQSSELISVEWIALPPGAPVDSGPSGACVRLERIRSADGRPIAFMVTIIPAELGEGIEQALAGNGSMYEHLRRAHALDIDSADETYRVGAADARAAGLLGIQPGTPVFLVERVGFAGARRMEWTRSVVRGDDYEVHVHLKR
ncbi:MAG: GntR family transcriptional regulator [Chloroflexota bacterium]